MGKFLAYSTRLRTANRLADCCDCEWYEDNVGDKNLTRKIKRHVEKTGHEVVYETIQVCRYKAH